MLIKYSSIAIIVSRRFVVGVGVSVGVGVGIMGRNHKQVSSIDYHNKLAKIRKIKT